MCVSPHFSQELFWWIEVEFSIFDVLSISFHGCCSFQTFLSNYEELLKKIPPVFYNLMSSKIKNVNCLCLILLFHKDCVSEFEVVDITHLCIVFLCFI